MTAREPRAWNALTNRVRSEAHTIVQPSPPAPGLSFRAACGVTVRFVSGPNWRSHADGGPRTECSECRRKRLEVGRLDRGVQGGRRPFGFLLDLLKGAREMTKAQAIKQAAKDVTMYRQGAGRQPRPTVSGRWGGTGANHGRPETRNEDTMGSKELIAQYEEAAAASGNPELFRAAEAVSWESYHGMGPQAFNLTPHPIMVHPADREPWEVPRTGFLARLDEEDGPERHEGRIGAPVVSRLFARVTVSGPSGEAYPFPRLGLIGSKSSPLLWVVSLPVAQALTGRPDVIAPDTGRGSVIRDDRGQVVGVRRFVRMGVECLECGHFQAATTLCEACGEFVGGDAVVEAIEAAD